MLQPHFCCHHSVGRTASQNTSRDLYSKLTLLGAGWAPTESRKVLITLLWRVGEPHFPISRLLFQLKWPSVTWDVAKRLSSSDSFLRYCVTAEVWRSLCHKPASPLLLDCSILDTKIKKGKQRLPSSFKHKRKKNSLYNHRLYLWLQHAENSLTVADSESFKEIRSCSGDRKTVCSRPWAAWDPLRFFAHSTHHSQKLPNHCPGSSRVEAWGSIVFLAS